MSVDLSQILALVGKLDDSQGEDTPRERFRSFLRENVLEVGQLRDYFGECLRNKGDQYNRALQDLVNYLGHFLGFEVVFGRYQGVSGETGFDGHWTSPSGFHVVVEVKTSEVYPIKAATLVGYVDDLISEKEIPDWDDAMGLYAVGRPDPEIRQLENAIMAEKRTQQLRIISVESLLSLAELMSEYDIDHEDILAIVRPSGPTIDPVIDLMARLVAEPKEQEEVVEEVTSPVASPTGQEINYWLTPAKDFPEETAEECIRSLVGKEKIYAFGDRTPGRKHIKPGDWIGFYAGGIGVVACARVASSPKRNPDSMVRHSEKYPWVFRLNSTQLWLDKPMVIDASVRARLDAFQGRDPNMNWAWFVQATRKISEHDFQILTRRRED
jgi:hypothetical protein